MDKDIAHTICFTGPRPKQLFGYDEVARGMYSKILSFVVETVKSLIDEGYDKFITGGAQGFDQVAFWSIAHIKRQGFNVENNLYLPFQGQDRIWNATGLFSQQEYNKMKRMADDIYYTTDGTITDKYKVVPALLHRNHCMVNDSSLVIALLAGRSKHWQDAKGGTAECVRYAVANEKKVLAITFDEQLLGKFDASFIQ